MRIFFLIALGITTITGCQTINIKNTKYKISSATTELGSIGHGNSFFNLENDFAIKSFPLLQNKIRLDIQIIPFNGKLNNVYKEKSALNQSQVKIDYADSLAIKPELVTISIMDLAGYTSELNQPYNRNVITYIQDTKEALMVTRIVLVLPNEKLAKLRIADTYYLINDQDKKYTIALYKEGKNTDVIDINSEVVLAYKLGRFCWGITDRNKWYIADIIEDAHGCKGDTKYEVEEKKETNLFKL